ncbi:hypothetical protein [Arthrobacter bambusae]|uniref:Uncharacterized protein n=1 Tax=Arthrobacter bambusae TaxID=1338426 RepID=A0AAW8D8I7_9MICC|nr:hypothetical protein [Arthrobacter bambusae]MDP9904582.1 hypothetical protein [Arthrobacter bambusae]MDQ0129398.1 hypothetical protein [Arthrobacter bambusae]MDQ0180989.1 hypothetical protein [Arthrobacter bambusae]
MKQSQTDEGQETGDWPEQYSGPLPGPWTGDRSRKRRNTLRITLVSAITVLSLTGGYFASGYLGHIGQKPPSVSKAGDQSVDHARPSATAPADASALFTDRTHGFAARFSGTPTTSTQKDTFYDGSPLRIDSFDVYDAGVAETVSVTNLPCNFDPSTVRDVVGQRFDVHVKTMAETLGGAVVVQQREETTVQSFPAVHGTFTITDSKGQKKTGTLLSVMHGASMIHVLAISEAPASAEIDKQQVFLDSFRFLDQAAPGGPTCRAAMGGSTA